MHSQIAFVHGGNGVFAHHRVAVESIPLIDVDREMISENDVATEQGYALNYHAVRRFYNIESDIGGVPDLMSRGDFGVLVPPEQPAPLADGILSLLDNPERAGWCGARARDYVTQNCTWDQRVDDWEATLHSLVQPAVQE